ncbi:MAG: nitrilase-related carbon-nitrogen hydrolase [Dehalococcoidia bacterium]
MKPFRIACCQVRAHDLEDAEENLANLLRSLDEAGEAGAQLVLLPECSYPAYYVRDNDPYARPGVRPYVEVTALFAEKARRYGYWLAAGMAVPGDDGTLTNSGVVFSPAGDLAGRYDKSFLWHFDNNWFTPGQSFPVWDAGFVRFGILICADSRQPEIARMLHVNGAELICDLTAWVSWARTPAELSTTQCEYLMPVRARENGTWIAAADKWGVEDGSIVYAGRSTVIDPSGAIRACAPSEGDTVVLYDIEPMTVEPVTRRPRMYRRLLDPVETLPAVKLECEPLMPAQAAERVAVVPGGELWDPARAARRFAALRSQGAGVVVFGGEPGNEGWELSLTELEAAVREHGGVAVAGVLTNACHWRQSAAIVTARRTFDHVATHGRGLEVGDAPPSVVPTPAGNLGVLVGDEGLVPEVARCLALEGADLLAWVSFESNPMTERFARTRSDENKVYTAAAWPGGGLVANPDGAVITAIPAGLDVAMTATTNLALSRAKERAPGTHVIRNRFPSAYGALCR